MSLPAGSAGPSRITREVATWVASIIAGGIFGVACSVGMGFWFMSPFGFAFGAVVGLACSPALMYALRHGPWLEGLVVISVPSATAAFIGVLGNAPNRGPFLSLGLSLSVYLLACLIWGFIARKYYRPLPPWACPRCEYDRRGLEPSAPCPECGQAESSAASSELALPQSPIETAAPSGASAELSIPSAGPAQLAADADDLEVWIRPTASCAASVGLGCAFGICGLVAMGGVSEAPTGFMAGGLFGLACAPALIYGLSYGPWRLGFVVIGLLTAAPTLIASALPGFSSVPAIAFWVAIIAFHIVAVGWGLASRSLFRPPPWVCPRCLYDRRGLEPSAPCPECGGSEAKP